MELENTLRPQITSYSEPADYLRDMILYRKIQEPAFSVQAATKPLRKVSPALISLIINKKRSLTLDRVDEIAKLLKITPLEKAFLRDWVESKNRPAEAIKNRSESIQKRSKETSTHILTDWINVYVKDCFEIPEIRNNPELIYQQLAHIAPRGRIQKSMQFLMREGHLRKTLDGHIEVETPLTVTDPQVPSRKIRQFHRGALQIARNAIEIHPVHQRFANTLLVPLTDEGYNQLVEMIREFSEKLKEFAAHSTQDETAKPGARLIQVTVNACPTGGKIN